MSLVSSTFKLTAGALQVGSTYGELTVIDKTVRKTIPPSWQPYQHYMVQCRCGSESFETTGNALLDGKVTHCGCLDPKPEPEEKGIAESKTRLYKIYQGIKSRCNNPSHVAYENYGGRGIKMCDEWSNSYEAFKTWSLANGYEEALTIDRKSSDGCYTPDNCRWATRKQQQRNMRSNHPITAFGETKMLCEWAEDPRCVVTPKCWYSRIQYGWSPEDALTKPYDKKIKQV